MFCLGALTQYVLNSIFYLIADELNIMLGCKYTILWNTLLTFIPSYSLI